MNSVSVRFIILAIARSGSSFLTTSLRSHPQVLCHGEVLLPRLFSKHVHGSARRILSAKECRKAPHDFVERLFELDDGCKAVGFKIFRAHNEEVRDSLLQNPDVRKIILRRNNILASYSSLELARKTGQWGTRRTGGIKPGQIFFDSKQFETYRKRTEGYYRKINHICSGPRMQITYEWNILSQNIRPVLDFLEVDPDVETRSRRRKMHGHLMLDRFLNPEAVVEHLDEIDHPEWITERGQF